MNLSDIFIQNMKKYRNDRSFTQSKLADLCNSDTSYIGQIEIGNRTPSFDMIEKIAKALKIRPHLLFYSELEDGETEIPLKTKKETISDDMKKDLINRLNEAISRVVKRA